MSRKIFIVDSLIIAAGMTALLMTFPAQAREHCTKTPAQSWKPVGEVADHASKLGYSITEVERDGTCYEVKGYDRNGARIEILYNPETATPFTTK